MQGEKRTQGPVSRGSSQTTLIAIFVPLARISLRWQGVIFFLKTNIADFYFKKFASEMAERQTDCPEECRAVTLRSSVL